MEAPSSKARPASRVGSAVRLVGRMLARAITVALSTLGRIAKAMSNQPSGPDPLSDAPPRQTDYRP